MEFAASCPVAKTFSNDEPKGACQDVLSEICALYNGTALIFFSVLGINVVHTSSTSQELKAVLK